jgi:putative protease
MRPEILAPAGDVDKLKTAIHFGADAVYLGLKRHSLRNFARNFDFDELEWSLQYAHERGTRVYVTLNMIPYDDDISAMVDDIRTLGKLAPDAAIVADPGVLALIRQEAPGLPVHLSTQANVTNATSARFWFGQRVERIIAARELNLKQLQGMVTHGGGPIEAFVHGAVCISYSGRCFLSQYWADRSANHGECTQSCRWQYREIEERRREGEHHYLMEDDRYTYFFDARDLCALPLLAELYGTGVCSWKIEGRMKSMHYVAVTTDVYRQAANWLEKGESEQLKAALPDLQADLARVSNRQFSTHFLPGGTPDRSTYHAGGSPNFNADAFVGLVVNHTDRFMDVALRNKIAPGTELELRSPGLRKARLVVGPLFATDGTTLPSGLTGTTVRIPGCYPASEGTIVRLAG